MSGRFCSLAHSVFFIGESHAIQMITQCANTELYTESKNKFPKSRTVQGEKERVNSNREVDPNGENATVEELTVATELCALEHDTIVTQEDGEGGGM
jgi:hypothetical protein